MADFELAFNKVIAWEGGYNHDPADPGGETKFGISKKSYPDLDIANITIDDARDIYYHDFWLKIRGPYIQSQKIAENIFDYAVNAGIKRSVRLAQKILGVKKDGVIGNITLNAFRFTSEHEFITEFIYGRIKYYIMLVMVRRKLRKYLFGWLKRALKYE